MKIALILASAVLLGVAAAAKASAAKLEPVDLDACYITLDSRHHPPANDHTPDYFVMRDGRHAFRSVKWVSSLAKAQGCDFVFTWTLKRNAGSESWHADLYSPRSIKKLANVDKHGSSPFGIADLIVQALQRGTPAYNRIIAERQDSGTATAVLKGKTQDIGKWWQEK